MKANFECRHWILKTMTRLGVSMAAIFYVLSSATVYGQGLAASAWPKFHANAANTGLGVGPAANGVTKWIRPEGTFGSPSIGADGTVYAASQDWFYALDGGSGAVKWAEFNGFLNLEAQPAIGADGTVYAAANGGVYAYDGAGKSKGSFLIGLGNPGNPFPSPTIGADGTIYLVNPLGTLYALNPQTLQPNWSLPTPTGSSLNGTPALDAKGTLYLGSGDGKLYAVATKNTCLDSVNNVCSYWVLPGTILATYSTSTGGSITTSPAVGADGTVYFGSADTHVYAVTSVWISYCGRGRCAYSLSMGTKWTVKTGGEVYSSPAIDGSGNVFIGSQDGKLYALAGATGVIEATFQTNSGIHSSPAISSDGVVYFASEEGILHAAWFFPGGCLLSCGWSPAFFDGWDISLGAGSLVSSPALDSAGAVYIGGGNSNRFAFK
jgi:outer membrane protein assembly factor BamB